MASDEYFLNQCEMNKINGFLRLYTWEPAALTLGCFLKSRNLNIKKALKDNIKIVRRITGGNLLLHNKELTYSLIIRRGIKNIVTGRELYIFIGQKLQQALNKINIPTVINTDIINYKKSPLCINSLSQYELVDENNKKIVASSQKIFKNSFLQHGTVYLNYDIFKTQKYLKSLKKFFFIFGNKFKKSQEKVEIKNDIMIECIKEQFAEDFTLKNYELKSEDRAAIDKLIEEKYIKDEWTFRK